MFREIRPLASTSSSPHSNNTNNTAKQRDHDNPPSSTSPNTTPTGTKRNITSLACTLCRQRRVKCDGKRPTCSACTVKGKTACEYDIGRAQRRTGVLQDRIIELENEIAVLKRAAGRSLSDAEAEGKPLPTSPRSSKIETAAARSRRGSGESTSSAASDSSVTASASRDDLTSVVPSVSSWTSYNTKAFGAPKTSASDKNQQDPPATQFGLDGIKQEPNAASHVREEQRQVRYRYRPAGDGMNLHLFGDLSNLGLPQDDAASEDGDSTHPASRRALVPFYLIQPLTYTDNQILSRAYSSFLIFQRQQIANGTNADRLVGRGHADVTALIDEAGLRSADPISRFIASLLATFGLKNLPEKLGMMHLLYVLLRWQINPTAETYRNVPPTLKPSAQQRMIPHPSWIDLVVWPDIRDTFIMHPSVLSGDGNECFPILMETACVRWPRPDAEMTCLDADTGRLVLTPAFVKHVEDLDNWSVGSALIRRFPDLVDKVWVQD